MGFAAASLALLMLRSKKWCSMTAQELRGAIAPKPDPLNLSLKRLHSVGKDSPGLKTALKHANTVIENDFHTPVLEPLWALAEESACCKGRLDHSSEPTNRHACTPFVYRSMV